MARSFPFAQRLTQSNHAKSVNAALWLHKYTTAHHTDYDHLGCFKPVGAFWVRTKNRLLDIWQKAKEFFNHGN